MKIINFLTISILFLFSLLLGVPIGRLFLAKRKTSRMRLLLDP